MHMQSIVQQSFPWKMVLLFSPHWWQYRLWSFKVEGANLIIFLPKNDFFSKETLLSFGMEWLEVLIFKIWFWNILGKNLSWKELMGTCFHQNNSFHYWCFLYCSSLKKFICKNRPKFCMLAVIPFQKISKNTLKKFAFSQKSFEFCIPALKGGSLY